MALGGALHIQSDDVLRRVLDAVDVATVVASRRIGGVETLRQKAVQCDARRLFQRVLDDVEHKWAPSLPPGLRLPVFDPWTDEALLAATDLVSDTIGRRLADSGHAEPPLRIEHPHHP